MITDPVTDPPGSVGRSVMLDWPLSLGRGHRNTGLSPDKKETPHNKPSARPSPPPRGILGPDASIGDLAMVNAKVKVRPDSRAGKMVKAMLDKCEVPRMPNLDADRREFNAIRPDNPPSYRHLLRRWTGVVDAQSLIHVASAHWGMDARAHDRPEVRRYLSLLGQRENWLYHTIYEEAFVLFSPAEARGRWMDATEGRHDFDACCPWGWKLDDGTVAGERRSLRDLLNPDA